MENKPEKPRIFIDADVLFAGSASPNQYSSSLVILRMAEITLIKAITSHQVITEVERNLEQKFPAALVTFRMLVSRCLQVLPDPTEQEVDALTGLADPKDLPILAAAIKHDCQFLTNLEYSEGLRTHLAEQHFQPGIPTLTILPPGDLVQRIRYLLSSI
jgi:predicted nucleic acid-binding protein